MSASHFFVGLGAGVAILAVPVLTLVPGADVPGRFEAWISGPPPHAASVETDNAAVNRPEHGFRPGDPTPAAPPAAPTLQPRVIATPASRTQPQIPINVGPSLPAGGTMRTGVIRSGGAPVYVRRAAGVESSDDPLIADGSPVLVSVGPGLQVGDQQWRAVRGLNGIVGWVPGAQVAVDGEPPILVAAAVATPITVAASDHGRIGNTDGVGVVLRNSPNDADRSRTGLTDGTGITVLERSGQDWVRVHADNGAEGWIPARYLSADR